MYLRHAKALGLQGCDAYRACGYIAAHGPHTCMQGRTMQCVALTQLLCMMQKAVRFAVELIVNFKFRLMIHLPCLRT